MSYCWGSTSDYNEYCNSLKENQDDWKNTPLGETSQGFLTDEKFDEAIEILSET